MMRSVKTQLFEAVKPTDQLAALERENKRLRDHVIMLLLQNESLRLRGIYEGLAINEAMVSTKLH